MHHPHRPHGIVLRGVAVRNHMTRWRSGGPHPKTDPKKAYGLIIAIEGSKFGKGSLRMAGIVKMLHIHRPPYGARSYIVVCQPNQSSIDTIRR